MQQVAGQSFVGHGHGTRIAQTFNETINHINQLTKRTDWAAKAIPDLRTTTQTINNKVNANHQDLTNKVNANHQALTNKMTENQQALTKKMDEKHQALTNTANGNYQFLNNKVDANQQTLTNTVNANHQSSTANHQALTNKVNANHQASTTNHQALTNALNQDREKTQGSLKKIDEDFKAYDKKIQLQAGQITGIQQRVVDASGRIVNLEVKAQQEKAGRDDVENRVKNIEGQVRGFNQIQADFTETKVRLSLIEQQNAIRFKSLETEKKLLEPLKQRVLNFSINQQRFKKTIEENKQESKAKHAKAVDEINQLRERIDNGDKAIKSKANAEEVPEQEENPILRAINQEKDDKESPELKQEEAKLAALMAAGGPKGDLKKIEWQSQVLARLEERNKLKIESLTHQMLALEQNMQQLEKREEASRKTDKKNHSKTSLIITQLREEIQELNAKKQVKRQSSLVNLIPNKKKTKSSLVELKSNKKKD